ncbi:MAG: hypothetical protein ACTHOJ_14930 [Sphingomonas oligoaromativorans]
MVAHRMIVAFARSAWAQSPEGEIAPMRRPLHSFDEARMFVAKLIEVTLPDLAFLLMCVTLLVRTRAPMLRGF